MIFEHCQPVILASRSPRRRELLTQLGINYHLIDIEIDESAFSDETPLQYAERIAKEKAIAGWSSSALSRIDGWQKLALIAADTCIGFEGEILGKPQDIDDAKDMLGRLSNQSHQVISSVVLQSQFGLSRQTSVSRVTFAKLSQADIDCYCRHGEGLDKAGSYAIQGLAAQFVRHIEGSYSGVVGLPLYETGVLLSQFNQQCAQ